MTRANPAEVAGALAASRKYRHLCPETLDRVARWACERHPRPADAEKAAKRKLHQAFAAFFTEQDIASLGRMAAALPGDFGGDPRGALRPLLQCHASTRERLAALDEGFYDALWAEVGRPESVLDLGCGLNPLALPWMGLQPGAGYVGLDLDQRLAALLGPLAHRLHAGARVCCGDLLGGALFPAAEVALLFKLLPTLDRQEPGAGLSVLRRLRCRVAVATWPVRSLGGRDRGMEDQYERQARELALHAGWSARRIELPGELAFVLRPG